MLYLGIFLLVFCCTLLIISLIHSSNTSQVEKRQLTLNQNVFEQLKNSKFNLSKIFYLNDYATCDKDKNSKKIINVDYENKKIAFVDYEKEKIIIVGFNEVLTYEVYENGSNSTFGGNAGGLFGGIFAAETNGMCKDLKLIIRLNSFENAQIVYNIISNTTFNAGLNKSTSQYKSCISSMQEVVSFLEVVKKQNRNTNPVIEDQF